MVQFVKDIDDNVELTIMINIQPLNIIYFLTIILYYYLIYQNLKKYFNKYLKYSF